MHVPSGHVTFTEEQADILEQRNEDTKNGFLVSDYSIGIKKLDRDEIEKKLRKN